MCLKIDECLSIDYNLSDGNCNFNRVTTVTDEISSCNNYQHFEPEQFVSCQFQVTFILFYFDSWNPKIKKKNYFPDKYICHWHSKDIQDD